MFLRHLRRTRLLLQVVDASAADPGTDYLAVREELRMYNPDYVTRPHVVALNKVDLEDAGAEQVTTPRFTSKVARSSYSSWCTPAWLLSAALHACCW